MPLNSPQADSLMHFQFSQYIYTGIWLFLHILKMSIFIVGAKRTPFGAFGGKLKGFSATELAVMSSKGALTAAGVSPDLIGDVFMGNVIPSSLDATYLARHVGLKTGIPIATPAMTINRLCGSGFETVCLGAESIQLGRSEIALCGGTENMSQAPMVIDGLSARWGAGLGKGLHAEDALWAGLTDSHSGLPMGLTAEKLAEQYGITREDCDEYALRSQNTWQAAHEAGVFADEIEPVEVKTRKGTQVIDTDEHPRKDAKIEDMAKLPAVFKKDGGVVTAGSASGICDGAASLVVAGEKAVTEHGLSPLARVVSFARVGCDPTIMGIGPVPAIRMALDQAGLTLADMDIVEINEAFAGQYLACEKELGLDRSKSNMNGGAIALGHPLGASGARIMAHLSHALQRTQKKYAVGAACIGGGQGIAVILERA